MSLVFAGHVPNDPQLVSSSAIPRLPKDQTPLAAAISEIEGELYFMKPDTVIFLTEHQVLIPEMINMHITPQFQHQLFTGSILKTDALLTSEIKGAVEVQQHTIPLNIVAEPALDERIAAPVGLMMRHLAERAKIIIFSIPALPQTTLGAFGDFLKREIMRTDRRVALFSTGHIALTTETNATASQTVERVIQKAIEEHRPLDLSALQTTLITESDCDSIRTFTVLFSCLRETNINTKICASETEHRETSIVINCILQ